MFRSLVPAIVLAVSACASFANSSPSSKSWRACGSNVVITTASAAEIVAATKAAHDKFSPTPRKENGEVGDSSLSQDATHGATEKEHVLRAQTTFKDKSGTPIEIESVYHRGEETIVFFTYTGTGGPGAIQKEFTDALEKQGVHGVQ